MQLNLITARKRSLRRLCFYTCLSVILFTGGVPGPRGGAWSRGEVPGLGRCLAMGGGCLVPGGCLVGGCGDPPLTATAAGGTHPTGMHSNFNVVFYFSHVSKQFTQPATTTDALPTPDAGARTDSQPTRYSLSARRVTIARTFISKSTNQLSWGC